MPVLDAARERAMRELARGQHGLVTAFQLRELGISRDVVTRMSARGQLVRMAPRVYRAEAGPVTDRVRWHAAVLAAGPGAALSHTSAARLHAIWRGAERGTNVTGRTARPQLVRAGTKLHRRRLDQADITVVDGIPVTTVARTLVDLVDDLLPQQLAAVMHEAAFRRALHMGALRAAMRRAGRRPRLGRLRRAIEIRDAGGVGTRSALEDAALELLAAAGLPEPEVNMRVAVATGTVEVDLSWRAQQVCVEIDGPGHQRIATRRQDRARDAMLRDAGYRVVRVGWRQLRDDAGLVVWRVQSALSRSSSPSRRT